MKKASIRFYDNQPDIIQQFKNNLKLVNSIQVSNKSNQDIMNGNNKNYLYTPNFLKKNPNNSFARYLYSIKNRENSSTIGFSYNDAIELSRWANLPIHNKVVIFDWDGTLSVIEGVLLPRTKEETKKYEMNKITYEDIAIYYCGGKYRFNWLRDLFIYLYKKNVSVYILTNNPIACNVEKEGRKHFFHVIKEIIPQIKLQYILCGYESNGFKPHAFMKNRELKKSYTESER
jgi:hypothetical protein